MAWNLTRPFPRSRRSRAIGSSADSPCVTGRARALEGRIPPDPAARLRHSRMCETVWGRRLCARSPHGRGDALDERDEAPDGDRGPSSRSRSADGSDAGGVGRRDSRSRGRARVVRSVVTPRSGVVLTSASGVHAHPIAEQVLGYLLAFERGLDRAFRRQRRGVWERFSGGMLAGKIWGSSASGRSAGGSRSSRSAWTAPRRTEIRRNDNKSKKD